MVRVESEGKSGGKSGKKRKERHLIGFWFDPVTKIRKKQKSKSGEGLKSENDLMMACIVAKTEGNIIGERQLIFLLKFCLLCVRMRASDYIVNVD